MGTNPLSAIPNLAGLFPFGFVAHQLQTAAGMRFLRAAPNEKTVASFSISIRRCGPGLPERRKVAKREKPLRVHKAAARHSMSEYNRPGWFTDAVIRAIKKKLPIR